ncbi:MAG: hypothetical protein RI991_1093, partial [Bacteroidota bacterium]
CHGESRIETNLLSSGIYIFSLEINGQVINQRFIKK